VKLVRLLPFSAAASLLAFCALSACDGVPEIVFPTDDASAGDAAKGADGETSSADGSTVQPGTDGSTSSGTDGSTTTTDGSTSGTDAGKDAGKDSSTVDSGTDSGEVCTPSATTCCNNHPCVRCSSNHCNSCETDCPDPAKPICCYDGQGNGTLTCQALGSSPCP
jgi:hypothetical protein